MASASQRRHGYFTRPGRCCYRGIVMSVVLQSKPMVFFRQFVVVPAAIRARGLQFPGFRANRMFSVVASIVFAVVLVSVAGCEKQTAAREEERKQDPVAVTVAPAIVASVQRTVDITGTLFGDEEATVSAKVPGRIVSILGDVGDRAAAAQPLAQIDQ